MAVGARLRYGGGMILLTLAIALLAQTADPAQAEQPCATIDTALPAELAGWRTTGTGVAFGSSFRMPVSGGSGSTTLPVMAAGRYRVALDQPGWIELTRDGRVLESVAHGHGPRCSSIRKIVEFDLQPGAHQLKLTKIAKDQARVMVWTAAQKE